MSRFRGQSGSASAVRLGLQPRQFPEAFGLAQVSQEMVADNATGEAHQDWCQGGQAFSVRGVADGRGDGVKKVVSGNP